MILVIGSNYPSGHPGVVSGHLLGRQLRLLPPKQGSSLGLTS